MNLMYNSLPPVQNCVKDSSFTEFPCLTATSVDENVPLEFRIDKTNRYTDPSEMYLRFTATVTKSDGTELEEGAQVSTVNSFGYALFSGVDVFVQDQKITSGSGYHQYNTYTMLLLHTTLQEKAYYLRQALWFTDTAGMFDKIGKDEAGAANEGYTDRAAFINKSAPVHILIKVLPDFKLKQLLPDQTEVFVRFHRASANSCLLAESGDFEIKISQARLLVSRVELTDTAHKQYAGLLSSRGLRLPATRFSTKARVVSKNDQNVDWTPISGQLPRRIYIFQMLNSAYNGEVSKNIFNYQFFGLKKIQLFKNGESVPLAQGIDTEMDNAQLLYTMSMDALNRPEAISFNSWKYRHGYFVAVFDLTRDRSAGMSNYDNPVDTGTIRVKINYRDPLEDAVMLFCMSEEHTSLQMDSQRFPSWQQSS